MCSTMNRKWYCLFLEIRDWRLEVSVGNADDSDGRKANLSQAEFSSTYFPFPLYTQRREGGPAKRRPGES